MVGPAWAAPATSASPHTSQAAKPLARTLFSVLIPKVTVLIPDVDYVLFRPCRWRVKYHSV